MMLSNVIVDVTIPRHFFVCGQSRAKVFAGFTNVRSLAVAAFHLVYCGGGGGGDRGVTISRLPYLFVPLSPDSRPLLCFSRYRVNDAV